MSSTSTSSPNITLPADVDIDLDTEIDTSEKANEVKGKVNLSKTGIVPVDPVDEPIEGSSPLKLTSDPNYLTNFCKNRNAPHKVKMINPLDLINGKSKFDKKDKLITFLTLGGVILILVIWYFFKYSELILPFTGGFLNILKFLIIYTVIIIVLIFFFKFVFTFKFWFALFVKYFKLFLNPLLNEKVSKAYCFFTSYVNWLIYYPAKLFYLICLVGISFIFFLIIVPIIAIISFVIGYLFSLLGDNSSFEKIVNNMKKAASSVKINTTTVNTEDLANQAKGAVLQTPDMMSKAAQLAPGLLSQAPGLLGKAAQLAPGLMSQAPGLLGKAAQLAPGLMKEAMQLEPGVMGKAPGLLDGFKYKKLDAI